MKRLRFVALLLVGATILGATVLREPIALAAQIVDANIVGPLDADGNVKVHEQGTPTVNAAQAGTWQVRAADNPAFQPFHAAVHVVGFLDHCDSFAVPVGKRLVLEFVSARVSLAGPDIDDPGVAAFAHFRVNKNGNEVQPFYPVPLTHEAVVDLEIKQFVGSEDVRVYAGPTTPREEEFEVQACVQPIGANQWDLMMNFSGYLVDVP